jgi:hypothetical protein
VLAAVGVGEERQDLGAVPVHVLEPVFGGLLVMAAVDLPVRDEGEVVLELRQQVVRGHLAAGEEIAAHPVGGIAGDEVIAEAVVREDVHEEEAAGLEPAGDVRKRRS